MSFSFKKIGNSFLLSRKKMLLIASLLFIFSVSATSYAISGLNIKIKKYSTSDQNVTKNKLDLQLNTQLTNQPKDPEQSGSFLLRAQNTIADDIHANTSVNVNGENIPIPENGTLKKEIINPSNKTTIDISIDNQYTDTSVKPSNSSSVRIYSKSHSSTTIRDRQQSNISLEVNQ